MAGGQKKTPVRVQALPGRDDRFSTAAGTSSLSQIQARKKRGGVYTITPRTGAPFKIQVKGRVAWALERLSCAGTNGCTPITEPAPRWSSYVHRLRLLGVPIETKYEPHGGEFSGTHARYVLKAFVTKDGLS